MDAVYLKVRPKEQTDKLTNYSKKCVYLGLRDIYPKFSGEYNQDGNFTLRAPNEKGA
jgi:hypothetical protein